MIDETENIRRQMVATINANAGPRAELESKHGQVWDTSQLKRTSRSSASSPRSSSSNGGQMEFEASLMFQNSPALLQLQP